jgi:hypothetical protein
MAFLSKISDIYKLLFLCMFELLPKIPLSTHYLLQNFGRNLMKGKPFLGSFLIIRVPVIMKTVNNHVMNDVHG